MKKNCVCGHKYNEHNNKHKDSVYYYEMKYNCCITLCGCLKYKEDKDE